MARKHDHPCAIAASLNILGDRWSLLIIREAFYGATRFGEFLTNTGISRNLLTERLTQLTDEGILKRIAFTDRGTSHAYALTEKGRALDFVIMALNDWGNKHIYGDGNEPVRLLDTRTGKEISQLLPVTDQGEAISREHLTLVPGGGADRRTLSRLRNANPTPFRSPCD